jgi:hypothetical protein
VITIYKGTALFDSVAISDTAARNSVREGRASMSRADARGAGAREGMRTVAASICVSAGCRAAEWFVCSMGSSRSKAAQSRTPRR